MEEEQLAPIPNAYTRPAIYSRERWDCWFSPVSLHRVYRSYTIAFGNFLTSNFGTGRRVGTRCSCSHMTSRHCLHFIAQRPAKWCATMPYAALPKPHARTMRKQNPKKNRRAPPKAVLRRPDLDQAKFAGRRERGARHDLRRYAQR
jgi:hypothetical protein